MIFEYIIIIITLRCYSQFKLVSYFRASCFMQPETAKCDISVNWNIAVVRQKF